MLETIREFWLEHLDALGEGTTARDAHAALYLAFAERAAPAMFTSTTDASLDRLAADHDNLRAALDWLCDGETL